MEIVRPDLHIALTCPDDWTVMELDGGLRLSDPTDPRVALQILCDTAEGDLSEQLERQRNSLSGDASSNPVTLRAGEVTPSGNAAFCGTTVAGLCFAARDASFVFRVIVAIRQPLRWTIRLETLQRKEWWQESRTLEGILTSLLLL